MSESPSGEIISFYEENDVCHKTRDKCPKCGSWKIVAHIFREEVCYQAESGYWDHDARQATQHNFHQCYTCGEMWKP